MISIAIVGAGPAGLMLALSVMRHRSAGADPLRLTFFEREPHHDRQPRANASRSYTIDITGHGRKALESIGPGLIARFEKELIPFRGVCAHMLGRVLSHNEGGWTGSRGDICSALLHELEAMLPDANLDCVFRWGISVEGVQPDDGTVTFCAGTETRQEAFDLIVGADGAGSLFRRQLETDCYIKTEKYSIPNYSRILHLDEGNAAEAFDPALLHVFSLRPGAVGGAILEDDAAREASEVVAADLPKDFFVQMGFWNDAPVGDGDAVQRMLGKIRVRSKAGGGEYLADFVSRDEMAAYSQRDVYHTGKTVLCSQLAGGRCVLLGDAASAFPPVGQGVNAALEAATVLGERLANVDRPGLKAAVEAYDAAWLPEARACATIANQVVYGSHINMISMFMLGALSDLTGVEMVGPQLAKDARYSYAEALSITRRRQRWLVGAIAIFLIGVSVMLAPP